MKTKLLLAGLLFCLSAAGRARVQNWCEQGGQTIQVLGYVSSINTPVQRSYAPGCIVTVYITGSGGTLATLYSDDIGTPLANPLTASSTGLYYFYVDDGSYDIRLSGGGIPTPFTLGEVPAVDPWFSLTSNARLRTIAAKMGDIVSVKDYGAKGNGSTDDSAAFQAAHDACPSYGCTILVPASSTSYIIKTGIAISKSNVTWNLATGAVIDGTGVTGPIISGPHVGGALAVFLVTGAYDQFVGGGTIKAAFSYAITPTPLMCKGCNAILVDGINLNGGYAAFWPGGGATETTIQNSDLTGPNDGIVSGWVGDPLNPVTSPQVTQLRISNNRIHNVGRFGVKLTSWSMGGIIEGNRVINPGGNCIDAFVGGEELTIAHNLLVNCGTYGIDSKYRDDGLGSDTGLYGFSRRLLIADNIIINPALIGIDAVWITPGFSSGVSLYGPQEDVKIRNNYIETAGQVGIQFGETRGAVTGNTIINGASIGIQIYSTDSSEIAGNFIVNPGQVSPGEAGIQFTSFYPLVDPLSTNIDVHDNHVISNDGKMNVCYDLEKLTTSRVHNNYCKGPTGYDINPPSSGTSMTYWNNFDSTGPATGVPSGDRFYTIDNKMYLGDTDVYLYRSGSGAVTVAAPGQFSTTGPLNVPSLVQSNAFKWVTGLTTPSVPASGSVVVVVTWAAAFPDAGYIPYCSLVDTAVTGADIMVHHFSDLSASALNVVIVNNDTVNPHTGALNCMAIRPQ